MRVVDTTRVKAVVVMTARFSYLTRVLSNLRTRPKAIAPRIRPA